MKPAPEVLDPEVLAQYETMSPGFSAELIALFQRDMPVRLAILRAAVGAADWNAVAEVAHTLKGSSGNLGAAALAEVCATLQVSAAAGDAPRIAALAREVERAWDEVQAVLAGHTSASGAGEGRATS